MSGIFAPGYFGYPRNPCFAIQAGVRDLPARCALERNHDGDHMSKAQTGFSPETWRNTDHDDSH